jgi:hypothetical protein
MALQTYQSSSQLHQSQIQAQVMASQWGLVRPSQTGVFPTPAHPPVLLGSQECSGNELSQTVSQNDRRDYYRRRYQNLKAQKATLSKGAAGGGSGGADPNYNTQRTDERGDDSGGSDPDDCIQKQQQQRQHDTDIL